jgi:16S rRNA (guanine966-N2)-methyltransferase
VRIIAGRFRGRTLRTPSGRGTRPTADRVREALFSMITSRIGSFEQLRVADLYAGSGALGFEAISRGASHATFLEKDREALAAIKDNASKLGVSEQVHVIAGSAEALPKAQPFDVIFADPPYGPGSGSQVVAAVAEALWLAPGGWMSIETERAEKVDPLSFTITLEREIGRARLTLLRRA